MAWESSSLPLAAYPPRVPALPDNYDDHPARRAARESMRCVEAKDSAAWLANFAHDAVVEDPIGPSMFDPDGLGHHGLDAIAAFYDAVIATNDSLRFGVHDSHACGNEVANIGTISTVLPGGAATVHTDGVFTYRVNDAGKVTALRAYWQMDRLRIESE